MKFFVNNKDFFEANESRSASVIFNGISSDVCKYVALVYDYFSPLHEIPIDHRKKQAIRFILPTLPENKHYDWTVNKNYAEIKKAVAIYREFQYDEEHECYVGIKTQLKLIADKMKDVKTQLDIDDSIKLSDKMLSIIQQKRKLEVMLKYRFETEESAKNLLKDVSTLDSYHNNNQKKLMEDDDN